MKCLKRNQTSLHYALYKGKEQITDEDGNLTGEYKVLYFDPVEMQANVSAASGASQVEQFGNSIQYDKVIVTDDISCHIDENTVLCVDKFPAYDANGNLLFDYIVKKVAKSLNSISFAISKVSVS